MESPDLGNSSVSLETRPIMADEVPPPLSIEDQLRKYKQRDLFPTLFFKAAVKSFGPPRSRRRIVIAPPMAGHGEGDSLALVQQSQRLRSHRPLPSGSVVVSQEEEEQLELQKSTAPTTAAAADLSKMQDYQKWMAERIKSRKELDSMGNVEVWLQGKSLLTDLECSVLERIQESKSAQRSTSASQLLNDRDTPPSPQIRWSKCHSITPSIRRPSPQALSILHHYLCKHGLRLIDLFRRVKKAKKGQITREEFKKVIQEANIPVDATQLDDLMVYLSTEDPDCISFKDLVTGYSVWKLENREERKTQHGSSLSEGSTGLQQGQPSRKHSLSASSSQILSGDISPVSTGKFISTCNSSSSPLLEVPPVNLEEWIPLNYEDMEEIGKRDRERRRRLKLSSVDFNLPEQCPVVRTGNSAIDSHSLPSTLSGECGEAVDQYRRAAFKEYMEVLQLCQKYNVALTEKLLEKALLHPGDSLITKCRHQLPRQPGVGLLSRIAMKQGSIRRGQGPGTSSEEHAATADHYGGAGSSRSRSSRSPYPNRKRVAPRKTIMRLSTGQAAVQAKTDCWMTFEEYARIMRKLKRKLHHRIIHADPNAFWPGYLRDKLCSYLPHVQLRGEGTLFSFINHTPRTNPGICSWPISDQGYMTSGDIDQKKEYYLNPSVGETHESCKKSAQTC